jgi:hypothetical protein
MPDPAKIVKALAQALEQELEGLGVASASAFINEAGAALERVLVDVTAGSDPAYVATHARARLEQLAALHLMSLEAGARAAAIRTALGVLHGLLAFAAS